MNDVTDKDTKFCLPAKTFGSKNHYLRSAMVNLRHLFLLLAIALVSTLPWLGLTDFNTKGEPHEAIVGLTMLEQGNWTLPTNNGGEMAYKPPMFH